MLDQILKNSAFSEQEQADLRFLGQMFQEHYHFDYHQSYLSLKAAFAPFNPDQETIFEPEYSEAEKQQFRQTLVAGIRRFLQISNYNQLSPEQFDDCLKIQTFGSLTLQVDTSKFDSFDVFYRGVREAEVTDRFLYFWKHQRKTVRISRVFVLAEYKSEWGNKIIAKQFRDVLVENLKIVAPEVKLLLPLFDRFKIGGTVIGSIVCSLVKIIKTLALGLVYSFFVISAFLLLWAFKGIFGFFNSRTRCMQIFSSNLYHNSLSNNVAAVSLLVDQAETQEVKEAWLGYYMLYLHKDEAYTAEQLDAEVEKLLETSFQFKIDFEVEDAIRKLLEKGLISEIHTDGQPDRYRVLIPIQAALKRLDAIWDAIHNP